MAMRLGDKCNKSEHAFENMSIRNARLEAVYSSLLFLFGMRCHHAVVRLFLTLTNVSGEREKTSSRVVCIYNVIELF